MPRRLGVNIDHVATLRQARRAPYPDPVAAAMIAELAGADQITCHIRSDRRHIQDADLPRLRDAVQTQLNVEWRLRTKCSASQGRPRKRRSSGRQHRVTLVPERPGEVSRRWSRCTGQSGPHRSCDAELVEAGILVSSSSTRTSSRLKPATLRASTWWSEYRQLCRGRTRGDRASH